MDVIDILFTVGFWAATLRIASPLIFATLGELICERAGVLNLGIEGIMTMGAMAGWMWVYQGGGLWDGVLFAAAVGGAFGLLHAIMTVYFGLSQHVVGIGITLLASSLSYFLFRMILPAATTPPKITAFQVYEVPYLAEIPFIGPALFHQTPLTYLAVAIVPVVWYGLYRTPVGLAVRSGAVVVGSAFMAVGGAFLTMSAFDAFYFGMVNGRGWICIALVIFASWRPMKALVGALLFAGLDALQVRAQQSSGVVIPYQFFLMLPFVLSIVAMIFMSRRATYPKALLVPFRRGERI